jgi:hypothetical protein
MPRHFALRPNMEGKWPGLLTYGPYESGAGVIGGLSTKRSSESSRTAIAVERHISAEGVFVWQIAMLAGADMALTVFSASDTFDRRGPLQLQFVRGAHGMVDQAATSRSALWKLG